MILRPYQEIAVQDASDALDDSNENLRKSTKIHGNLRQSKKIYENPRKSTKIYESLRKSMK